MPFFTSGTRKSSLYAGYVLALLCGIAFTNAMDASILAAVIPSIQKEFHLSDAQIGVLSAVFVLSTAIAVLPLGYWADRAARRTVIALGVGFWSLATLLTGLTRTYPQILAARSLVGIGEASLIPAGTSLVGDFSGCGSGLPGRRSRIGHDA